MNQWVSGNRETFIGFWASITPDHGHLLIGLWGEVEKAMDTSIIKLMFLA